MRGRKKTRRMVERYLEDLAPLCGLSRWTFTVEYKRLKAGSPMNSQTPYPYNTCVLEADLNQLRRMHPRDIRLTVIHELGHCVNVGTATLAYRMLKQLKPYLTHTAYKLLKKEINDTDEAQVVGFERMPVWDEVDGADDP